MRVAWEQRTDRQWMGLLLVGALIVVGVVLLQGIVLAATPEAEAPRVERDDEDVAVRVLSTARGSRIGISVEEIESSPASGALDEGAYVSDVREGMPAADAGVEAGDVIVEFDDERVRSAGQLSRLVQETPAGRAVSVTVMRDGDRRVLEVTPEAGPTWMSTIEQYLPDVENLGRDWAEHLPDPDEIRRKLRMVMPADPEGFDFSAGYFLGTRPGRLGIEVTSVSSQLADYFGVEAGALVASVESDSVAAAAGLRAGDVITAVNADSVDGVATLRRHVTALEPGQAFTIDVTRDGVHMTLDGQLEQARPRRPPRRELI